MGQKEIRKVKKVNNDTRREREKNKDKRGVEKDERGKIEDWERG